MEQYWLHRTLQERLAGTIIFMDPRNRACKALLQWGLHRITVIPAKKTGAEAPVSWEENNAYLPEP